MSFCVHSRMGRIPAKNTTRSSATRSHSPFPRRRPLSPCVRRSKSGSRCGSRPSSSLGGVQERGMAFGLDARKASSAERNGAYVATSPAGTQFRPSRESARRRRHSSEGRSGRSTRRTLGRCRRGQGRPAWSVDQRICEEPWGACHQFAIFTRPVSTDKATSRFAACHDCGDRERQPVHDRANRRNRLRFRGCRASPDGGVRCSLAAQRCATRGRSPHCASS